MNGRVPLLSLPVTKVIGPRALAPLPVPPLLPPPQAAMIIAVLMRQAADAIPLERMDVPFVEWAIDSIRLFPAR
jgi:hypothetical protein